MAGDALVYGDLAHNLLAHGTFALTEKTVRPTLIRLPGYPLFLALCFAIFGEAQYVPVLWLQAGVDLASCFLLAGLARRLWGERAGWAALWLAALCPFVANYTAVAITETLSVFCVVLAFVGLERWLATIQAEAAGSGNDSVPLWGSSILLGIALAGAVLLRPDQGLLAAAVLPCMVWAVMCGAKREFARGAATVCLVGGLFVLPLLLWGMRNWKVFHVVQPLAPRYANDPDETVSFGFQRWYRTWAVDYASTLDVYWTYDGASLQLSDLPGRAFDGAVQKRDTARLYRVYNEAQSASPEVDAGFAQLAQERVTAHPFRYYVVLPLARELNMWLRPRTELLKLPIAWWRVRDHPLGSGVALAFAVLNGLYLLAALFGLWRWREVGWRGPATLPAAMMCFILLRCVLLLTIDNSEPRYTLECFPILFLLGSCGFADVRRKDSMPDRRGAFIDRVRALVNTRI